MSEVAQISLEGVSKIYTTYIFALTKTTHLYSPRD